MESGRRIGVFLQLDIDYGRGILRGVASHFRRRPEYTVLKFLRPARYRSDAIRRLGLDGIIAKISNRGEEEELAKLGIPVVNVSGKLLHPRFPTVNTDDLATGRIAFAHLRGRGFRHFAFAGSPEHLASRIRWRGFRLEARRAGASDPSNWHGPFAELDRNYPDKVRRDLAAWLRSLPRPVALYCFTDRFALECEQACVRADLAIPEDVSILGTGNDATRLEFAHTELSSIKLNTQRIGEVAACQLQELLAGREPRPHVTLVPPVKIVARQSTDRHAVDDEIVSRALDYIRENAGNAIYVDEVARDAGVSRRALELRFRQAIGSSVNMAIVRIHLERATDLLAEGGGNLNEVAFASGFSGAPVFSRTFRRHIGTSPRRYVQNLHGAKTASRAQD